MDNPAGFAESLESPLQLLCFFRSGDMMTAMFRFRRLRQGTVLGLGFALALSMGQPATAQVTAYKQAIAEAASADDAVAAFYRGNGYGAIWTGEDAASLARRAALIDALRGAAGHGLPAARYDPDALVAQMAAVRTTRDLGLVEVALSQAFVDFARDLRSGILIPSRVDPGIDRKPDRAGGTAILTEFTTAEPAAYLRELAPLTTEYLGLRRQMLRLEALIAEGGWGPTVRADKLEPGDSGAAVVALRDRLIRMGYMERSASRDYDRVMQGAVQLFQAEHGLEADGVAGTGTIAEINIGPEERLKSVLVALERERWLGGEKGERYVMVNQADFVAKLYDHGQVTFETRVVIGKNIPDRRSPEFSDEMEHVIINPSWHVPRSIIANEYLPQLRANPYAAGHLIITDRNGRQVNRGAVDFSRFGARNFPFDMRQPPGARNALGRVKFMFPNTHNVYMHDTPDKHLFARETRAFSHGCIRLADPYGFAYAVLASQVDDPKSYFQRILDTGRETRVDLDQHIPVHIIYRTALTGDRGRFEYRRDVYDRDAKIWAALQQAGVVLPSVDG
jgi:murein L,D-transpeptidase YcbB/YkuD